MPIPLRVLIIEDSPDDAELMVLHLTKGGFQPEWQRVETEPDYLAALGADLDLILADWRLPNFSGLRALKLMKERGLDIPFIIVSGSIGEETAIDALRQGAGDYVLKDRPARLGQAVQGALEGKRLHQERKRAEEALRLRMEQLVAINQASQAVATSLDLDQVLTEVMSLAGKVVGSEYTSIVLVGEDGHISRGVENMPGVLSIERRARKRGFTNWILRARRPAVVDEIGEAGVIRPRVGGGAPRAANPNLVAKGIKSFVGLPLIVEERTVGVLYLHSLRPGTFHDQLTLLTTFASQAAIAIEKARLYDVVQKELAERKRAETELQASREAERNFAERLTILSETTTELSKAESLDALCRRAVELGRERLDFDRLAIWFIAEDRTTMLGSFGVDTEGRITDERRDQHPLTPESPFWPVIQGQIPLLHLTDRPLYMYGQVVGQGAHVVAGLWDGKVTIGYLSVDNLLRQRPYSDSDCELIRLYATAVGHLVTLQRARVELHTSEERYRLLFELSPDSIAVYQDGKVVFANPAAVNLIGAATPEEFIGKPVMDFVHPDYRKLVIERSRQMMTDGEIVPVLEEKFLRLDGTVIDVDVTAAPVNYQNKSSTMVIFRDITARKLAEDALRESEGKQRSILEAVQAGIVLIDAETHAIVDVNPAAAALIGETREQIVGSVCHRHICPAAEGRCPITDLKQTVDNSERVLLKFDGTQIPIIKTVVPIVLGGRQHLLESFVDISERKRAEEALQESNELYSSLVFASPEAIMIIGLDGKISYVSPRGLEMYGYKDGSEVIGHSPLEWICPEDHEKVLVTIANAFNGSFVQNDQYHLRRKDGSEFFGEFNAALLLDKEKKPTGLMVVTRDVTERKLAEAELQASRESEKNFAERLAILSEITTELSKAESLDALCRRAVELGRERLDFDRLAIWFIAEDRTTMLGSFGVDTEGRITDERADQHPLTPESEFWPVTQGQTTILHLTDVPLYLNQQIVGQGAHICAGLSDGKVIFGYMSYDNLLRQRPFSDNDREIIRLYASAVGKLCSLQRAQGELYMRNEELARLYRASGSLISGVSLNFQELAQKIVEVVQQEFGQANCSLLVVQKDSNELVRLVASGSYADQVKYQNLALDGPGLIPLAIRTNKVVNVGDVHSAPDYVQGWEATQSELAIPLKVGSSVIGAIDMQSSEPNAFSPDDERLMTVFAEQAALTLEHGRLNAQIEVRLQQLTALRTVDMAISGSFDINLTLGVLLDQVTGQLGVHAADILAFNATTQTFKFACERGFRTQLLHHTQLRFGVGYAWRAIHERRVIVVPDIQVEPDGLQRSPDLSGEQFVAYLGVPLIAKGEIKGVLEVFHREPFLLEKEWYGFLEMLAGQAAIAIDNAELFDHLQSSNADLTTAYDSTLEGWASALELRDKETEGHTRRVIELITQLARALGVKENDMVHIYRGALLHDIGKVGVPDSIVLKPGPLTEDEWVIMRKHPQYAYDMLSPIAYLRPALNIPYCHHEKWDGTGYPRGLKGEQIPLAARIFAVIDVWDALTSNRPYRKAWPEAKARQYIQEQAGLHFDPQVVRAFLNESFKKG